MDDRERVWDGIDVSAHNGRIDWDAVGRTGVDFALLRCGYGQDIPAQDDTRFADNAAGCEAAGIPWGAFLYSYAVDEDSAASEARHALRLLRGRRPLYPVFVCMEDADGYKARRGVSYRALRDICARFCGDIREAGGLPGVRAGGDWLMSRLRDARLEDCEQWAAGVQPCPDLNAAVWQYGAGLVAGIDGRVGLIRCRRDYPAIIRADGLNDWRT